ncbi:MAG: GNAT family N-acetyltransferase [Legionella sp.]|uniref:GNAT family N-acetyltransferase n=1 Tax=Legionella sp. TaxID=459 RepID=UPI0039E68FE9
MKMSISNLKIYPATSHDALMLADIRVNAMRPSLEAINRFDPIRARNRFLSSFEEKDTFVLTINDTVAGFYVLRTHAEYLYLDHLYLKEEFQRKGLGRTILQNLKTQASALGIPIRLMALDQSPANAFYLSLGFTFERIEGVDNYYFWEPTHSLK